MNAALQVPLDVRLMNWTATMLLLLACAGALVLAGTWALRLPVFSVVRVSVTGDLAHTQAAVVRERVAGQLQGNFFTMDLAQVRTAFEHLPWVRRAQVRRDFPNGLEVQLQEHDVAAYWGEPGSGMLVNRHGEVFEADGDGLESDNLPRLLGTTPDAASDMLQMVGQLAPVLAPLGSAIDTLQRTAHDGWRVTLDSGAVLQLGASDSQPLLARAARMVRTLAPVAQQQGRGVQDLEYADLRYADGYALRLRGVTTIDVEGGGARNRTPGRRG